MCALIGFFTVAECVAVHILAFGPLALFPFKVRAHEKGDAVQEYEARKRHQQDFKEELAIKAVRTEPDGLDTPPHCARCAHKPFKIVAGSRVWCDQVAPQEVPGIHPR